MLRTAERLDSDGHQAVWRDVSMVKVAVPEMAQRIADRAMQLFGAMGGSDDAPIHRAFAVARMLRIADGPDEVHLRQIFRQERPARWTMSRTRRILRAAMTESGRKRIYAIVFGLILTGITLAGLELLASLEAPSWPARALRSTPPVNVVSSDFEGLADKPWIFEPYNSWGMRDKERSVAKPASGGFRSVFVGDSYLEFQLTRLTVPGEVERRFIEGGQPNAEMINLGISATGPRSYYYRLRDVAFALSPDALAVFFFSGNDFLFDGQGYGQGILPDLVSEAPGGSILGNVMPNANWVLVNRLRLSEMLTTNKPVPQEFDTLAKIARLPPAERTPAHRQPHQSATITPT